VFTDGSSSSSSSSGPSALAPDALQPLLMDGLAPSGNGVWLYDQHLQPARWLKVCSVNLDDMTAVAD
jgi:hypothetical protein